MRVAVKFPPRAIAAFALFVLPAAAAFVFRFEAWPFSSYSMFSRNLLPGGRLTEYRLYAVAADGGAEEIRWRIFLGPTPKPYSSFFLGRVFADGDVERQKRILAYYLKEVNRVGERLGRPPVDCVQARRTDVDFDGNHVPRVAAERTLGEVCR